MADRTNNLSLKKLVARKKVSDEERAKYASAIQKVKSSITMTEADGSEKMALDMKDKKHLLHLAGKYDIYARQDEIESITKRLEGEVKISSDDPDVLMQSRQIGYEEHNFWIRFKDQLPLLSSGLDRVYEAQKENIGEYMIATPFISMGMRQPGLILVLYGGKRPAIIHSFDVLIRYLTVIQFIRQSNLCKSFSESILNHFCKNRRDFLFVRKKKDGPKLLQDKFDILQIKDEGLKMRIMQMINERDRDKRESLKFELGHCITGVTTEQFRDFMKEELYPRDYLEQIDAEMRAFREMIIAKFIENVKKLDETNEEDLIQLIQDFNLELIMSFEVQIIRLLGDIIPEDLRDKFTTNPELEFKTKWISSELNTAMKICNDQLFEHRKELYQVDVSQHGEGNYHKKLRHFILQFS